MVQDVGRSFTGNVLVETHIERRTRAKRESPCILIELARAHSEIEEGSREPTGPYTCKVERLIVVSTDELDAVTPLGQPTTRLGQRLGVTVYGNESAVGTGGQNQLGVATTADGPI